MFVLDLTVHSVDFVYAVLVLQAQGYFRVEGLFGLLELLQQLPVLVLQVVVLFAELLDLFFYLFVFLFVLLLEVLYYYLLATNLLLKVLFLLQFIPLYLGYHGLKFSLRTIFQQYRKYLPYSLSQIHIFATDLFE